jgi:hypothetical protein
MKLKLPELHYQILIALVLGIILGAIFKLPQNSVVVSFKNKDRVDKLIFHDWRQFQINVPGRDTVVYMTDQQSEIISYVKNLKANKYPFDVRIRGVRLFTDKNSPPEIVAINKVISVDREDITSTYFKWVGDICISFINTAIIPLVIALLIFTITAIRNIKKSFLILRKIIVFLCLILIVIIAVGFVTAKIISIAG